MKMRLYFQKYEYVKTLVVLVREQSLNELKNFKSFHWSNKYLLSS